MPDPRSPSAEVPQQLHRAIVAMRDSEHPTRYDETALDRAEACLEAEFGTAYDATGVND